MSKIATTVYDTEDITLMDGTQVTLKPLAIGRLRKFNSAWKEFSKLVEKATEGNTEFDEDGAMDVYINCCGIALEQDLSGKVENTKPTPAQEKAGKVLSIEYKEYLEEVIDTKTAMKVLEVCGGLGLGADPNLVETTA